MAGLPDQAGTDCRRSWKSVTAEDQEGTTADTAGRRVRGLAARSRALITLLDENRVLSLAVAVTASMYLVATFFNRIPAYAMVFYALAAVGWACAFMDRRAAVVLLACIPVLDTYAVGYQFTLPLASVTGAAFHLGAARRKIGGLSGLDLGVAGFALATIVSVPLAVDQHVSLVAATRIAALVVTYFFLSRAMLEPRTNRLACLAFAAAGTWCALVAIGQFLVPVFPVPLLGRYTIEGGMLRVVGFASNANTLGVTLVLSALVCTEQALRPSLTMRTAGWTLCASISALGIALTLSRGAYVGLAVGVVVLVVLKGIPRRALAIMGVALVALIIVAAAAGAATRAASVVNFTSDSSSMDRIYLSKVSMRMFNTHVAQGVGISGFGAAYPQFADPRVVVTPVLEGHQMFFSIPAETGLLGLLAELVIGCSLVVALFRVRRRLRATELATVGLAASLGYAAMSFFNTLQIMSPLWLALAWAGALMLDTGTLCVVQRADRQPVPAASHLASSVPYTISTTDRPSSLSPTRWVPPSPSEAEGTHRRS